MEALGSPLRFLMVISHLLSLDAGTVHVSIEEDDGKSKDENGVWIPGTGDEGQVTHTVPLAAGQEGSSTRSGTSTSPTHHPPIWDH